MKFPYACQCVECDEKLLSELRTGEEIVEAINDGDKSEEDDED